MTVTITFRDTVKKLSPPWLQRGLAEKLLYSLAIQLDAVGDALVAGVKLRFPGLYSNESLPLIGNERRIRRGNDETEAAYAVRLRRWLDDHQSRGGPYALLAQLFAHYAPNNFAIQLIYRSGRRFTMDVNGNVTYDDIVWAPDPDTMHWARWWLVYQWPLATPGARNWADGNWGAPDRVWGSGLTPAQVTDLRLVPREWNAAHAIGRLFLLEGDTRVWGVPPHTWGSGVWGSGPRIALDIT